MCLAEAACSAAARKPSRSVISTSGPSRSAMILLTPPVITPAARQATQEYIDWLENDKKRSARPADFEVQREREETARQKIAALLGESVANQGALEAADTFLSSLQSEPAAR